MAAIRYLHCRHCGESLDNHDQPYCPPCNLYLAYRAMPLILGLLLTGGFPGRPLPQPVTVPVTEPLRGYEAEDALIWE
ncbi:MAG: hypothetical protein A2091_07080 [Desulfuromonadales bacterium GWD2_61_12]|nr:MAG: hypothetical protein A2005_00395 [Desulfuromonadales bacterium GWC2_61_20]OGR34628.1 MAG: hypothetical protein A2091_07080 [Desulfuromonadales bacterium GWD2_61_12]HAD04265.1 hypothetical protein [Desulfuromonas sp.]HBT83278.1 hypothetical protein [Desulfuromonas sp.]